MNENPTQEEVERLRANMAQMGLSQIEIAAVIQQAYIHQKSNDRTAVEFLRIGLSAIREGGGFVDAIAAMDTHYKRVMALHTR